MRKPSEKLAIEYELGRSAEDFYNYIVESYANGNRKQAKILFGQMNDYSQRDFLINFLDVSKGIHKSAMNLCIEVLTPKA